MELGDIGKVQTLSSYEIGTVNCEEAERINIKNKHNQFLPDPLFQKRLQAFDSNTLKSLFLNAFEVRVKIHRQERTCKLRSSITTSKELLMGRSRRVVMEM